MTDEGTTDELVVVAAADSWPEDAADVEEGILTNWFVREGAAVTAGEVICEIQIEKVSVDVVAPVGGTVDEIRIGQGEELSRGDELATIRAGE